MLKFFYLQNYERGFLIKDGIVNRILPAGRTVTFSPFSWFEADIHDLRDVRLTSEWLDVLWFEHKRLTNRVFERVETQDDQVAVIFVDDRFFCLQPPGRRQLYWKELAPVRAEFIPIGDTLGDDLAIPAGTLKRLPAEPIVMAEKLREWGCSQLLRTIVVPADHVGLLYRNGVLDRELPPGFHGFWTVNAQIDIVLYDGRVQTLDIQGQELLTKDRVGLRINLSCTLQITDARKMAARFSDWNAQVYLTAQHALRRAIGTVTLDEALARRGELDTAITADVREGLADTGVDILDCSIKDLVLPGEMREIMNMVLTAEKQAQANLIRRREETAATRSQLNTVKLMSDNPLLLRLKELEAVERIVPHISQLTLTDGLDGLLNTLFHLRKDSKTENGDPGS